MEPIFSIFRAVSARECSDPCMNFSVSMDFLMPKVWFRRQGSRVRGKLPAMVLPPNRAAIGTTAPPTLAMTSSLVPDPVSMSMLAPAALGLDSVGSTSPVGMDLDLQIRA